MFAMRYVFFPPKERPGLALGWHFAPDVEDLLSKTMEPKFAELPGHHVRDAMAAVFVANPASRPDAREA
jgi:hypothetical protein